MTYNRFCTPWGIDCGSIIVGKQVAGSIAPEDATPEQITSVNRLAASAPALASALVQLLLVLQRAPATEKGMAAIRAADAALDASGVDMDTATIAILRHGMPIR